MTPYQSNSGKQSGVIAYTIGDDFINVLFSNKRNYYYSYRSAGRKKVEMMKELAERQEGLSTFIAQHDPGFEE